MYNVSLSKISQDSRPTELHISLASLLQSMSEIHIYPNIHIYIYINTNKQKNLTSQKKCHWLILFISMFFVISPTQTQPQVIQVMQVIQVSNKRFTKLTGKKCLATSSISPRCPKRGRSRKICAGTRGQPSARAMPKSWRMLATPRRKPSWRWFNG